MLKYEKNLKKNGNPIKDSRKYGFAAIQFQYKEGLTRCTFPNIRLMNSTFLFF